MANVVPRPVRTYWMKPPQNQNMEDGTQLGEAGYVDPHEETMAEWEDIDKGSTGGFRADGTAILHSDPDSAGSVGLLESGSSGLLGESGSSSIGGGYGKKRKGDQSRGQMNLTGSQGSSILTS